VNSFPIALVAVMTDGFVFLDTETTGMDSDSRVIDIALVQTSRNGELQKIYDSLIHGDGSSGGSRLVSIHHITNEMIENAPLFDEVWLEIEPLLHNRIIVAHNAPFDRKRINYELARIGAKPLDEFLCTFKLAKFLGLATKKSETSTGTSGKLEALAARFGITIESAHRALPDTKALVAVFWKMKEHFPDEVDEYISQHLELQTTHSNLNGSSAHEMVPKFTPNSFEIDVQSNLDQEQIFNRMDLRIKDLSNRKLNGASFCQLMGLGTIFSGSSLDHSDFSQAYLEEAKFKNVSAVSTYFDRADLTNANMRFSNFQSANFIFADLSGANFTGANLEGAIFNWANLSSTNFTGANLTGAEFFNSVLEGTVFLNAIVDESVIPKELHNYDFSGIDFTEDRYKQHWKYGFPDASFTRAKLHGLTLKGKDFSGSDFTSADLSGADLSRADLSDADFTGADLSGVDFSHADLRRTNFTGANLYRAKLIDVNVEDAVFINANCYQATFRIDTSGIYELSVPDFTGANLQSSDFSGSQIDDVIMAGTNLFGANFSGSIISSVDFSAADLRGVNFSNAELQFVTLSYLQLIGAVLNNTILDVYTVKGNDFVLSDLDKFAENAICLDFGDDEDLSGFINSPIDFGPSIRSAYVDIKGDFSGWKFSSVNLQEFSLLGSNLVGCDFSLVNLTDANLGDTNCTGSNFYKAILHGTSFDNANLSRCSFESVDVSDADFTEIDISDSYLSNVNFSGMEFAESDFSNCNLDSVDFSGCNLSGCTFTGSKFSKVIFVGADLSNADFSNASLLDCDLERSDLTGTNFAGSNLERTNLFGTGITAKKLRFSVVSNTVMPDGSLSGP
jgi:uncharacterized protein YjbI with pentapeptide repeats